MSFVDASGNKREEVRIRWWDPVGFSDKAQHFSRVTIEQRAQPAPGKVGGRGGLNRCCVETAVLIFLATTARAGIVAAMFHLPVSRIAFTDYGDLKLT